MTDWALLGRGTIARVPFITRAVLYHLLPIGAAIVMGLSAGIAQRLGLSPDGPAAPPLGMAALLAFVLACLVFVVLMIRIVAARARDIGWPPVWVVLAYLVFVQLPLIVLAVVPGKDQQRG